MASGVGGAGMSFKWQASALGTGDFTATLTGSHISTITIAGSDVTLATGGALASGKPGFYSERTNGPSTYDFDNFTVAVPPALIPALYSGRSLEVTGAETRRQNSTGTVYGRPPYYRGSRFRLNRKGPLGAQQESS